MGLTTPDGSLNSSMAIAVDQLGGTIQQALVVARRMTTLATDADVERILRVLQVVRGKTYAQQIEKITGEVPSRRLEFLGIDKMLLTQGVTLDELDKWYAAAEQGTWEGTTYQPLPDKGQCAKILREIRQRDAVKSQHAYALIAAEAESKKDPEPVRFTVRSLKAALALGLWPLMFPEQREACWRLLEWTDLPREAVDSFWRTLSERDSWFVLGQPSPSARGLATQRIFERVYGVSGECSDK